MADVGPDQTSEGRSWLVKSWPNEGPELALRLACDDGVAGVIPADDLAVAGLPLRKAAEALGPPSEGREPSDFAITVDCSHPDARDIDSEWGVVLTLGPDDRTVAADLPRYLAVGIAHALDAVYGCRVYDHRGEML